MIYLDHNATTPLCDAAYNAMLPYLRDGYGNASSLYKLGQEARRAIDRSREQVAALIGVKVPEEIVFTSGGSESINWAIKGACTALPAKRHIVTTKIEHSATMRTCQFLETQGWHVTYVGVDWHGRVNAEHIREAIKPDTALVSVMSANNEIGTLQPVAEIGRVCRDKGVLFHIDAVQMVGKYPVSVDELSCDLLSIAAHKFYGPKGVGALYVRPGTRMHSMVHGGRHERNRRAGTENTAAIVGMGAAAEFALQQMATEGPRIRAMRDRLEKGLLERIECSRVNGHPTERTYNTTNLSIEAVEGEGLIVGLDMQGICASSGSACSSGQMEPSHVLQALGLPIELAKGSLRLSLGRGNTDTEIDHVLEAIPTIIARLRSISPLWSDYKKGLRKSVIPKEAA